jgi:hypothetical protein
MLLSGSKHATLQQARLIDIHGTRFFDLVYSHDDEPERPRTARVGAEEVYDTPKPGDAIVVHYVMNVAVRVTRRE